MSWWHRHHHRFITISINIIIINTTISINIIIIVIVTTILSTSNEAVEDWKIETGGDLGLGGGDANTVYRL